MATHTWQGRHTYAEDHRPNHTGSIVANNGDSDLATPTAMASFTGSYNLVGNSNGDLSADDNNIFAADPQLAPLGNYGGPTQTMPPLPTSPAVGANGMTINGDNVLEQRGLMRGGGTSIGSVQVDIDPLYVNTLADDPVAAGEMSFRDAANLAPVLGGYRAITFDPGMATNANGTLSLGNTLTATAILRGTSLSVDLSSASLLNVMGWNISYLNAAGATIGSQTLISASGNVTINTAGTASVVISAYDYSGDWIDLPGLVPFVAPSAPTGLAATGVSSAGMTLTWTDHATNAPYDLIYESTDNGTNFYPIDEVNSVSAGSTNTYVLTGLTPGSSYQFYVAADGGYAQSNSNTLIRSTTFVPPTLDVQGSGAVLEGQSYELDLAAQYADGEPGAIDHWLVDWKDGTGGSSDVISYSYSAGADKTQPLVVTHTFNSHIASPVVAVTAVDTVNGSFAADPQPVAVTPIQPTGVTASVSNSSVTVNWTNASMISTGSTVLLSSDNTNFFEYGNAAAGASTLTINDLNLDTQYWVKVLTDSVNGESAASDGAASPTAYSSPSIVLTPTNHPDISQQANFTLSATYPANTPAEDLIAQWQIDWGQGDGPQTYNPSTPGDLVYISSPNYSATTTTSATIQILGIDGTGRQITTTRTLLFAPPQPGNASTSLSAARTSATITWTGNHNISTNYQVRRQTLGSNTWQIVGTVSSSSDSPAGSDQYSFTDSTIDPALGSNSYLYSVVNAATGANVTDPNSLPNSPGISNSTTAPLTNTSPTGPTGLVFDGSSSLSADTGVTGIWSDAGSTADHGDGDSVTFTVSNLPIHMSIHFLVYGGITSVNYPPADHFTITGPGGVTATNVAGSYDWSDGVDVPDLNGLRSATFTLTGSMPDDGRRWTHGNALVYINYGSTNFSNFAVDAGGETRVPIHYSCNGIEDPSIVHLKVSGFDSRMIQPLSSSIALDSNGDGSLLVKGLAVGDTQLVLEDDIGDQSTQPVSVLSPSVSGGGDLVEGGIYNTNAYDVKGFNFNLPVRSLTDVVVHYDTGGSTLPTSLLGVLNSGVVTIPAGEDSVFVPFSVEDDHKVDATLVAVVTLDVPGVSTQPSRAQMSVTNIDNPIITMNGADDNAVIPLDPQNDDAKLTTIAMSVPYFGKLKTSALTWNEGDFKMWLTKNNRQPGGDLASQTDHISRYNGTITYTWDGAPPATIYGQDLSGSGTWDSTQISLTAEVIMPATAVVPEQTGSATKAAKGTANGAEMIWKDNIVTGVLAGDMLIGQRVGLSVRWDGPKPVSTGIENFSWNVPSTAVGNYLTNVDTGYVVPISILNIDNVHFYWGPVGQNGGGVGETVSCNGQIDGNPFSVNTHFDVWTPNWSLNEKGKIGKATDDGNGFIQLIDAANAAGVVYTGTVTDSGIPASLAGGHWSITQLATPGATLRQPGKGLYAMYQTGVEGLDTYNHVSFDSNDPMNNGGTTNPVYAPVGPTSHEYADSPGAPLKKLTTLLLHFPEVANAAFVLNESFRTFLMFSPPGDSIDVPLAVVHWHWGFLATSTRLASTRGPGPVIWNIISRSPSTADAFGRPTSKFPEWTYVVHGDDFRKVI